MFESIRKVFGGSGGDPGPSLSAWASSLGLQAQGRLEDAQFGIDGMAGDTPWRMERGAPSRDFIRGSELRGRSETGAPEDLCAMVINRPLKEALESRAYARATDSLRTTADSALNEEMRWLAMFDEVRWSGAPHLLWQAYSVVSDQRETAQRWLSAPVVRALLARAGTPACIEVPFVLMLLRGKVYLRQEFTPPTLLTLGQTMPVYGAACEAAAHLAGPFASRAAGSDASTGDAATATDPIESA